MKLSFIIVAVIILTLSLSAKRGTVISFSYSSINCKYGRSVEFADNDNNNKYDKAYFYNCYWNRIRICAVQENYNLSDIPGMYFADLVSGSHESDDFIYIITNTKTKQSVAKMYYNGDLDIVIVDKLSKSNPNQDVFTDALDDFFICTISNNGYVFLRKKKDITVQELKVTDLSGNEFITFYYDNNLYDLDLTRQSQGVYFIYMITSEGFLTKRIVFMK